MTRDDWILAAALLLGAATALRARALGEVRILVPLDPARPTLHRQGDRLLFRFASIRTLDFWATLKPRLLLTLLLFTLWAPLLDRLGPGAADPVEFLRRFTAWLFYAALVAGGLANLWLVAPLVVMNVAMAAFEFHPVAVGLSAGVLFGVVAGKVTCLNYLTLLEDTRREIRQRQTRDGQPLSLAPLLKRRAQLWVLRAVPFMMLYEALRFFRPEIDLGALARGLAGFDLGRYALVLAALGLGLNVTLAVVPLFREMLERSSIVSATGFNNLWLRHEAQRDAAEASRDKQLDQMVGDYFGARGEWTPFGIGQSFVIYVVTLVLAANGLNQGVGKLIQAGLSPSAPKLEQMGLALSCLTLVANLMFLLVLLGRLVRRLRQPAGGTGSESTVDTLWRAAREPELVVVCSTEGQDIRVEPARPGSGLGRIVLASR